MRQIGSRRCSARSGPSAASCRADMSSYLLIDYRAERDPVGWKGVQRLFADLATPLAAATSTTDECFFAIWEGYGFTSWSTAYAVYGDGVDRDEMDRLQREAQAEDAAQHRRIAAALSVVPTFELPNRGYYLVAGSVQSRGTHHPTGGRRTAATRLVVAQGQALVCRGRH